MGLHRENSVKDF
jgi:hypothetical protein